MSRPWSARPVAGVPPLAVLVAAALAGCGGGEDDATSGTSSAQAAPTVTTPRKSASRKAADRRRIRRVANTYVRAIATKRWKVVCSTRTRAEVREYRRFAGSCERFFEAGFGRRPEARIIGTARASRVRIYGDRATVTMVQPGQTRPVLTLDVLRDRGAWKLGKPEGRGGSPSAPTAPDRPPTGPPSA